MPRGIDRERQTARVRVSFGRSWAHPALALLAVAVASCGRAADTPGTAVDASAGDTAARATTPASPPSPLDAAAALCRPAEFGALRARIQGAIDAELDWAAPATPQCVGGPRPSGDGVRLVFKGQAGTEPLLLIIGIALEEPARTARNVGANVTVVREGAGRFFATQGDDKCALDEVMQEPLPEGGGRYRLSGRGYCTQPARAVGSGEGAVLVSRFDVEAVVEYPREP